MKLYFETKKYPYKKDVDSIAIDTEKKLFTISDYFEMSCKFLIEEAIIITKTEYNRLLQKCKREGYQYTRYID